MAVALVEEVLFRAWLQEEIAVDMGFHKAVFISALAFALVHWYAPYQKIVCVCVVGWVSWNTCQLEAEQAGPKDGCPVPYIAS